MESIQINRISVTFPDDPSAGRVPLMIEGGALEQFRKQVAEHFDVTVSDVRLNYSQKDESSEL